MKSLLTLFMVATFLGCRSIPHDHGGEHPYDRFNTVALRVTGAPRGGQVSVHARSGMMSPVSVASAPGQSAEDVLRNLADALAAQSPAPGMHRLPFLQARFDSLLFDNVPLGELFLVSTDPGIETLPSVRGLSASRDASGVTLRWTPEPRASGYIVFRDGLPIGRTGPEASFQDGSPGGAAPRYEVSAHRDGEIVSPPARIVP